MCLYTIPLIPLMWFVVFSSRWHEQLLSPWHTRAHTKPTPTTIFFVHSSKLKAKKSNLKCENWRIVSLLYLPLMLSHRQHNTASIGVCWARSMHRLAPSNRRFSSFETRDCHWPRSNLFANEHKLPIKCVAVCRAMSQKGDKRQTKQIKCNNIWGATTTVHHKSHKRPERQKQHSATAPHQHRREHSERIYCAGRCMLCDKLDLN